MSQGVHGVITALITPFKNGAVDTESFRRLIRQQLDLGVQGFVVNGTTGESPTLELKEVNELFKIARSEAGAKIPILVGAGLNSTARNVQLAKEISGWGPDA